MAFPKSAILGVAGMLTFGTGTMISAKLMLDMSAKGLSSAPPHKFEKPIFQSIIMFWGMAVCIILHFMVMGFKYGMKTFKAQRAASRAESSSDAGNLLAEDVETPKDDVESLVESEAEPMSLQAKIWDEARGYIYIAVPATFDLLATTLMTFGLIFIDVSVMQMLRGSMVIFSALLSVTVLRKHLRLYQWTGVATVALACAMVGVSCIMGARGSSNSRPAAQQALGCLCVVGSQFIQASQIVAEEILLHGVKAAPLQVVGMEGVWGSLITMFVVYPIAMLVPGSDPAFPLPYKPMENVFDDFAMMFNNKLIFTFSCIYFLCILVLNYSGMLVTSALTAVHRTIFEAVRTLAIWITDLFIYYLVISGGRHTVYGERFDLTWSFLQAAGFATLVFGMAIYNDLIRLPGIVFKYGDEVPAPEAKDVEMAESETLSDIQEDLV
ncbi:Solute carrier family 25 member F6-like [Carpediemonas membranifera]|uniref:Solute carrier family 25 member F6-like n=1 Tax=Carpediemonas membranifera TaxID=201153 RepID=A0A8J6E7N6_9EUKA|nr:Solute carrier family 25 member F6-like [Carpediemonas membranifera]|eukprot:KAG9390910.1 Solute carrier family 25 member F6-like [Carpediemonas membranifera]